MNDLEKIVNDINKADNQSEARKKWQPSFCGSIDIRISSDGNWHHEGRLIRRKELVKLFANILRKENDSYYLVTPVEKVQIQVDDAPFIAIAVDTIKDTNHSALVFTTNLDEQIIVDDKHPILIKIESKIQTPRPYVHCRNGLNALLTRNVFYELVNMAQIKEINNKTHLSVNSMGRSFELGSF